MATEMSISQARAEIGDITSRAEYRGETTYLTKNGRRSAAVVSAERAELLEDLETLVDHQAVQDALDALASGTETTVPFRRRTRRADAE